MSDKELIKQEIERLKNHTLNIQKSADGFVTSVGRGRVEAFNDILKFIDSLLEEPASEDLEEEADNYFKDWTFDDELSIMAKPNHYFAEFDDIKEIARHFAEWQKERDYLQYSHIRLKDIKDAWQTLKKNKPDIESYSPICFVKGAEWQKQQMMKNAVETTIVNDWQYGKDQDHAVIPAIHQRIDGFNVGDKAKIIIIKSEQQ